jgi:hypothetical protein
LFFRKKTTTPRGCFVVVFHFLDYPSNTNQHLEWAHREIAQLARIKPITQSEEVVLIAQDVSTADSGFKDELNLAEFPIAALADRVPDGQLSLVFEDRLEQRDGVPIVRRLTITGTHKHGLPTAMDDEVMVGLIQLTKRRNNFTDARVNFSRYELIDLLGWPQSGQSYRRIEEALHRWVGVVLMYENAWWDNTAKSWVDENFHILDNVTVYDRERRAPAKGKAGATKRGGSSKKSAGGDPLPLSSFRWNEVIFRSFQSGNLKQLDLEFYLSLRLPTTKRLFRFLDKRFYRTDRLDFDLKTFACEHIGMSRTYKPTELKRRLKPALDELEGLGFLEPLPLEERYSWQARGQWRILFIRGMRGREESTTEPKVERAAIIALLVERGVTAKVGAELVDSHSITRVRTKLEVFDWLVKNEDKRVAKNPAGYLVASIRSDYQAPPDFPVSGDDDEVDESPKAKSKRAAAKVEAAAKSREVELTAAENARIAALQVRWDALNESDRDAITARVKAENPGLKRWKTMLMPLCLAELGRLIELGQAPTPHDVQKTLFPDTGSKRRR